MKVQLSVSERLSIDGIILPGKGDIAEMMIARDIRAKVTLSAEDKKAIGFAAVRDGDNQIGLTWDQGKDKPKDVDLSGPEVQLLKDAVERLHKAKNITASILDICLKIRNLKD